MRAYWLVYISYATLSGLPINPLVISGGAHFESNRIDAANGTVIHWDDFSIEEGERLEFVLPEKESMVLNRVIGVVPSRLMGALDSNGRIVLVNPHGILIGKNGSINTNAFIASSLDVIDRVFIDSGQIAGRNISRGIIVNQGVIRSDTVCLAGFEIQNPGRIESKETALVGAQQCSIGLGPMGIRTKWNGQLNTQSSGFLEPFSNSSTVDFQNDFNVGFDGIQSRNMSMPTVIQNGKIVGSKVLCLADALEISGEIAGKEVFLGGDFEGKSEYWESAKVVRIDGRVNADGIKGGRVVA